MTKERALYILQTMNPFGEFRYAFRDGARGARHRLYADGITAEEDDDIRNLWETMPGSTCYYDAVVRIAQGKGGAQ